MERIEVRIDRFGAKDEEVGRGKQTASREARRYGKQGIIRVRNNTGKRGNSWDKKVWTVEVIRVMKAIEER
jgi:hypothetical protein